MAAFPLADWIGRDDCTSEGALATRWHQLVKSWHLGLPPGFVISGFASDEGVRRNQGRPGAAQGPAVLRRAMSNLAWHQLLPLYDAGNIVCNQDQMEDAQSHLARHISDIIAAGHLPITLGGGHETAWGSFLGLVDHIHHRKLGIINLDAHFDLRESSVPHSGTPFAQMAAWCQQNHRSFHYLCAGISEAANTEALFQQARKLNTVWIKDEELIPGRLSQALSRIAEFMQEIDLIYLSIDLDVLPVSVMKAVSAPAALGVSTDVVLQVIELLAQSGKLLIAEVVEYNPLLDQDQTACRVAARIIWHLTRHWLPFQEQKR